MRAHVVWSIVVVLASMAGLMVLSSLGDSVTCDEVPRLAAGYSYLTRWDYRISPAHPPLVKDIAAVPLVLSRQNFPEHLLDVAEPDILGWEIGEAFLYDSGNDPDRMLLLARIPFMIMSLILGLLVFAWSRELFGDRAALLGLVLYAFNTTVIAHSRIVSVDLAVSLFIFLTMYLLYRYLIHPTWPRLAYAGLALGGALSTKMMAVLLVPTLLAIFAARVIKPGAGIREHVVTKVDDERVWHRVLGSIAALATLAGTALLVTYLVFLPHSLNTPAATLAELPARYAYRLPPPVTALMLSMTDHVATKPILQLLSTLAINVRAAVVGHVTFLWGRVSTDGWWYYYPVALLLKTQLALFALGGIAVLFRRRLRGLGWFSEMYLLALPAAFLVAGMMTKVGLGVRYMLPIFPFLFVSLSRCADLLILPNRPGAEQSRPQARAAEPRQRLVTGVTAVLLAWYVISAVAAFPYYMSYFNELVGGHRHGSEYLRDSNNDWGQDVKRLARWVERNQVEHLYVDVFYSPAAARYYLGDRMTEWSVERGRPNGLLAVSVNQLEFAQADSGASGGPTYAWLERLRPIAEIGGSIRIYDCRDAGPL